MEVEKYKMTYTTKINKDLEYILSSLSPEINDEIESNDIRMLGHDFVKNNENKAKLVINNKKHKLKGFISTNELLNNKLKIKIILSKNLSNISHMFQNCAKLIKLSIYDDILNIDNEKIP